MGMSKKIVKYQTEREQQDKNFIEAFFVDIGIDVSFKSISRLGTRDEASAGEKRPMKVVMHSEEDKDLVMSHLSNLKGKETYKDISISGHKIMKEWA